MHYPGAPGREDLQLRLQCAITLILLFALSLIFKGFMQGKEPQKLFKTQAARIGAWLENDDSLETPISQSGQHPLD